MKKFETGTICCTCGVMAKRDEDENFNNFVKESLDKFTEGDWGTLSEDDVETNEAAIADGESMLLGAYEKDELPKIWIITDAGREVTTVLFPSEY